jgi:hypothetical protein
MDTQRMDTQRMDTHRYTVDDRPAGRIRSPEGRTGTTSAADGSEVEMGPRGRSPRPGSPLGRVAGSVARRLALMVALLAALPAMAVAHGPVDPPASSYLAKVSEPPPGVHGKVVDGDQRMWLRVDPDTAVLVLDYSGAPYLKFSRAGVDVNQNSDMYYLNQVPAEQAPGDLTPRTAPSWHRVSDGHAYEWHDGRLAAFAKTVLTPGRAYVGRWSIALIVDGHRRAIGGPVLYATDPPLDWLWPIAVVVFCVPAALRLRRRVLDLRLARSLSLVSLFAIAVLAVGEGLHGRPSVSVGRLIWMGAELTFVLWGLRGLRLGRHGWFGFVLVAVAALWQGLNVIGVLWHGFVLLALPAPVARMATALCVACGCGLLAIALRLSDHPATRARAPRMAREDPEWRADDGIDFELRPPPARSESG